MAWKTSCVSCPHLQRNGLCGELHRALQHGKELGSMYMNNRGEVLVEHPATYLCNQHPDIQKARQPAPTH